MFLNRLGLPEKWRGMHDEGSSKISGIDGCIFCHAGAFIGGDSSYECVFDLTCAT